MVARLSLRDDVLALLVGALVHALHHVLDLLQLQPLQVLVLVQGLRQQLLDAVGDDHRGEGEESDHRGGGVRPVSVLFQFFLLRLLCYFFPSLCFCFLFSFKFIMRR